MPHKNAKLSGWPNDVYIDFLKYVCKNVHVQKPPQANLRQQLTTCGSWTCFRTCWEETTDRPSQARSILEPHLNEIKSLEKEAPGSRESGYGFDFVLRLQLKGGIAEFQQNIGK